MTRVASGRRARKRALDCQKLGHAATGDGLDFALCSSD
jgi:hypothetical protein